VFGIRLLLETSVEELRSMERRAVGALADDFTTTDIAFFAVGEDQRRVRSRRWRGCLVIDKSAAFRMKPECR
jgi:aspartate-semialdehyde dehydrogenase